MDDHGQIDDESLTAPPRSEAPSQQFFPLDACAKGQMRAQYPVHSHIQDQPIQCQTTTSLSSSVMPLTHQTSS